MNYVFKQVYDDFYREDQYLRTGMSCTTGEKWLITGAGYQQVKIEGGCITSPSNVYCYLPFNKKINRIAGVFSFHATSENDPNIGSMALIADTSGGGLLTMLHLVMSPTYASLQKRIENVSGSFPSIIRSEHSLLTDGTRYNVAIEINGGHVTLVTPTKKIISTYDVDVENMNLTWGCWQIIPKPNAPIAKWHLAHMGDLPKENFNILYGLG
jgi:hypothetical protein